MKRPARPWLRLRTLDVSNPVWWVLAPMVMVGIAFMGWVFVDYASLLPEVGPFAVVMFGGMAALWWWLLTVAQLHTRMHASAKLFAFLWGGFAATGVFAIIPNEMLSAVIAQQVDISTAVRWSAAIVAPLTEEVGKGLGIIAVLLLARTWARTPMEGAMVGAFVGLGFEFVENVLYAYNANFLSLGEDPALYTGFIFVLRSVLFGLVGHVMMSALVGAGTAYLVPAHGNRRIAKGLGCVAAGFGIHALWNAQLIDVWFSFVLAAILPVGVFFVIRIWRSDERAWFRAVMTAEVTRGTLGQEYVDAFPRSLWTRQKHRNRVAQYYGPQGRTRQVHLECLMIDLADALSRGDDAAAGSYRGAIASMLGTQPTTAT